MTDDGFPESTDELDGDTAEGAGDGAGAVDGGAAGGENGAFAGDEAVPTSGTLDEPPPRRSHARESDGGDATLILDVPMGPADPLMVPMRWDVYGSAHHIGIELKHLEENVRALLDPIDQRRKRKFNGTRRWHELEDDLRAMRFTGKLPEETIAKVLQLVAKRHTLYRRLSFLSSTRPTWNT